MSFRRNCPLRWGVMGTDVLESRIKIFRFMAWYRFSAVPGRSCKHGAWRE